MDLTDAGLRARTIHPQVGSCSGEDCWGCEHLRSYFQAFADAIRDAARAELEAMLFVERGRDYPAVDAFVKAAGERDALVRALEDILIHFTPEHIDNVSGSDCGSRAKAALARQPRARPS